jgi:hypothetical protein
MQFPLGAGEQLTWPNASRTQSPAPHFTFPKVSFKHAPPGESEQRITPWESMAHFPFPQAILPYTSLKHCPSW